MIRVIGKSVRDTLRDTPMSLLSVGVRRSACLKLMYCG